MKKILCYAFVLFCAFSSNAQTIKVNEVLAQNTTVDTNEYGKHSDWFELYNTGSSMVDVAGMYVTDDATNSTKYQIPTGFAFTQVAAHGYLIIWCDDSTTHSGNTQVHVPFKLSLSGEFAGIYASNGTTAIDSTSFGAQTSDQSFARCPDGTGTFTIRAATPGATNCVQTGIDEATELSVKIYPNPFSTKTVIEATSAIKTAQLITISGALVANLSSASNQLVVDAQTLHLTAGVYFIKVETAAGIHSYKLIVE